MSPILFTTLKIIFLVLILAVALWADVKYRRIPNKLSLLTVTLGISLQTLFFGLEGINNAILGLGIGFIIFFPAYLIWHMGAGDVKLIAALGTFLGPWPTAVAALCIMVSGGVLALLILLLKQGALPLLRRYALMLKCFFRTGTCAYVPAASDEPARLRFPYAIAIATGTLFSQWWLS